MSNLFCVSACLPACLPVSQTCLSCTHSTRKPRLRRFLPRAVREKGERGRRRREWKRERNRERERHRDKHPTSYTLITVNPFSCLCVPACLRHRPVCPAPIARAQTTLTSFSSARRTWEGGKGEGEEEEVGQERKIDRERKREKERDIHKDRERETQR